MTIPIFLGIKDGKARWKFTGFAESLAEAQYGRKFEMEVDATPEAIADSIEKVFSDWSSRPETVREVVERIRQDGHPELAEKVLGLLAARALLR